MKKYCIICLIIIVLFITGCKSNKIKTVSNITLGEKQYIEQAKIVNINNTEDFIVITAKVTWPEEVDEEDKASIIIPYTIHVDGKDYSGSYILGHGERKIDDGNPKYELIFTDVKKTYETEVIITNK